MVLIERVLIVVLVCVFLAQAQAATKRTQVKNRPTKPCELISLVSCCCRRGMPHG